MSPDFDPISPPDHASFLFPGAQPLHSPTVQDAVNTSARPVKSSTANLSSATFIPQSSAPGIEHLNRELEQAGYRALDLTSQERFIDSVVKTVIVFLGQQHSSRSFRDSYEERIRRVTLDYEHALAHSERLKVRLERSCREADSLKAEQRSMANELKILKESYTKAKEEVKLITTNHARCKAQFATALRKRDVEVTKSKERAQKIINEKYRVAKLGVVGLNAFRTAQISFEKDTEEYYTGLIRGYSAREATLVKERLQLQKLLGGLAKRVAHIVGITGFKESEDKLDVAIIEGLGESLAITWKAQSLRKPQMHNMATQTMPVERGIPDPNEARVVEQLDHQEHQVLNLFYGVEALGAQINGCRQRITEQDARLEQAAQTPRSVANSSLADLESQRLALEKERAEIAEAIQRMRRERALLESERSFQMSSPQLASGYDSLQTTPHTILLSPKRHGSLASPFPKRARLLESSPLNPNARAGDPGFPKLSDAASQHVSEFWDDQDGVSDVWKEA
ncbi:hypothetical protein L0F63_000228 [Massospora cicadina]|nr:hypothetical protein L0F63_000228 [Massospora cicadina]